MSNVIIGIIVGVILLILFFPLICLFIRWGIDILKGKY